MIVRVIDIVIDVSRQWYSGNNLVNSRPATHSRRCNKYKHNTDVEQCEEIQTENVYKEYSAIQLVDNWEWRQYKQASCLRKKL